MRLLTVVALVSGCLTETHVVSGREVVRVAAELRTAGEADVVDTSGDELAITSTETVSNRTVLDLVRRCDPADADRWHVQGGSACGLVQQELSFERTDVVGSILLGGGVVVGGVLIGILVSLLLFAESGSETPPRE